MPPAFFCEAVLHTFCPNIGQSADSAQSKSLTTDIVVAASPMDGGAASGVLVDVVALDLLLHPASARATASRFALRTATRGHPLIEYIRVRKALMTVLDLSREIAGHNRRFRWRC